MKLYLKLIQGFKVYGVDELSKEVSGKYFYCPKCGKNEFRVVRFMNNDLNLVCLNEQCKQIISIRTKIFWDIE